VDYTKKKVILESSPVPVLSWKDIISQKDGPNVSFFRFLFGRLCYFHKVLSEIYYWQGETKTFASVRSDM